MIFDEIRVAAMTYVVKVADMLRDEERPMFTTDPATLNELRKACLGQEGVSLFSFCEALGVTPQEIIIALIDEAEEQSAEQFKQDMHQWHKKIGWDCAAASEGLACCIDRFTGEEND